MISQPKDYEVLRKESNFDRMKRKRKRNKFWLNIASIIMVIAMIAIVLFMKAKYG